MGNQDWRHARFYRCQHPTVLATACRSLPETPHQLIYDRLGTAVLKQTP
jgi:hypothetical protein